MSTATIVIDLTTVETEVPIAFNTIDLTQEDSTLTPSSSSISSSASVSTTLGLPPLSTNEPHICCPFCRRALVPQPR